MRARPDLQQIGNWILTVLFVLGLYAFANLALAHYRAEGLGMNTWIYILAALGAMSLALRYGRAGLHGSSDDAPA